MTQKKSYSVHRGSISNKKCPLFWTNFLSAMGYRTLQLEVNLQCKINCIQRIHGLFVITWLYSLLKSDLWKLDHCLLCELSPVVWTQVSYPSTMLPYRRVSRKSSLTMSRSAINVCLAANGTMQCSSALGLHWKTPVFFLSQISFYSSSKSDSDDKKYCMHLSSSFYSGLANKCVIDWLYNSKDARGLT